MDVAGLRLSGCKNVVDVERVDETHVRCATWGITLAVPQGVPTDVRALGVREFNIEQVAGPGVADGNVFRAVVDRVSDSRFERGCLLRFLDRDPGAEPLVDATQEEMKFLSQHATWRLDMLTRAIDDMPVQGREVYVRIPAEKMLLVCK